MADANDRRFEDTDLSAIISSEIDSAQAFGRSEIDGKRALALEYAQGRMPDIQTLPNRSKMVSRDVADTNAWILPGIVRVFTSSDQMVEFEATKPGSDQWALDATEFMNYDFMRNNNGYQIVYNASWDAIHLDMGVVSSEWVPVVKKRETIKRQTLEQLVMLEEEGVEILTAKESDEFYETEAEGTDEYGQPAIIVQQVPFYDVKVNRIVKKGHIRDETLRPENLILNDSATCIEDARFCAYRYDNKTRSDLMAMADDLGFDKDVIRELPIDSISLNDQVELARRPLDAIDYSSPVSSGDLIDLYRCFTLVDVDGDGIAEMIEAWYAGQQVLAWQVWEDDNPYTDIPCYPIPHRFNGESVADRTMDIQRAKTVLLRQGMDNLYATNVPTQEVEVGSVLNPDALVQKRFGAILWKKPNTAPIVWGTVPYVADKVFSALSYFDDVIAKRTGVSRTTQALDPESLQNQTATASQAARDAGYSQIELIARNMAELGWSRFFAKRLKLAIKYQQVATVPAPKEEQKFREVHPQEWDEGMGVTINVGLGTGSKDRDMSMLNTLMNVQTGMAQQLGQVPGAQAKAIEFIPKILNTAIKLAESSGLKNPDSYFPIVSEQDVQQWQQIAQQPQPDPRVQIEQVKSQEKMQESAQDHAYRMAELEKQSQADAQAAALKSQEKIKQIEIDGVVQQDKVAGELEIKRRSLIDELNLARELGYAKLDLEKELKEAGATGSAGVSSDVQIGGDPG